MSSIDTGDDSDVEEKNLVHRSPSSPKAVRFAEEIPLGVQHAAHGSNYSPQKKIGPLGRKRLQSGSGQNIRCSICEYYSACVGITTRNEMFIF